MAHDFIDVATRKPPEDLVWCCSEGPRAWNVVMTNPRCEHRAQSGLIDKGFGVYLPQFRLERLVKRGSARKIVQRMLFPRYLFVSAPYGSWPRITSTDGVQALVRDCGRSGAPLVVSDAAVKALLDRQNDGEFDCWLPTEKGKPIPKRKARKMAPVYHEGSRVKIVGGAFASFFATVVEALAGNSAQVLVEIFGRPTPLEIDLADLQAA